VNKRSLKWLMLALLLVVGGVWYVASRPTPGTLQPLGVVQAGDQSLGNVGRKDVDLAALPTEQLESEVQRDQAEVQAAMDVGGISAGRAGWWRAPRDSTWAVGRVELPEGTPSDETLWVTAEGSRFSEHRDSRDTHTVIAGPDGSFRVAFSSRTHSKGKLWVRGRYCYMDEPLWVQLADLDEEVVLKPKLGGRLLVKVLPPRAVAFGDGVLEGVSVEAGRGSFPVRTSIQGWDREQGQFEIGGVEPGMAYTIVAHSERYADGEVNGISVDEGDILDVDVPLSLGATVAGIVTDASGVPIEGARVYHISAEQAAQRIPFLTPAVDFEVLTHAGRFELNGVPAGERTLVVEAEGFLEKTEELGDLHDGERRLSINLRLDAGRHVAGTVLWPDGTPAVGADIRLAQKDDFMGMEMGRIKGEAQVGPDGGFYFSALGEGPCELTASSLHPSDRPAPGSKLSRLKAKRIPRWMARAEGILPGTQQITLTLSSGAVLTGKVIDDAGEAVTAFRVTASPETTGFMSAASMKPVRKKFKDKGGEFALQGVQVGRWEVRVSATGYGDSERQKVTIPGTDELRFVVPRTSSISGTVRAPDGSGVGDARVVVQHGENKSTGVDCSAGGEFLAADLEPGWIEISATAEGYSSSETQKFQIASASKREGLVLALRPGAVIAVQLHQGLENRSGRRISLSGPSRKNEETDSSGTVRFTGLEAGAYTVSLAPDFSGSGIGRGDWVLRAANSKKAEVEVLQGEEVLVVLGEPSPTAITVSGTVTRGGDPLASAIVLAEPKDGDDNQSAGVRADDLGRYEMILDHPGDWRFQVGETQRELVVFQETVSSGDNVELHFALPEGRIEGRITGTGGRPEEGVRVMLSAGTGEGRPAGFAGRFSSTTADGEYKFKDLQPGTYIVRAGGSDGLRFGDESVEYGRVMKEIEVEYADQVQRVDIALPQAGQIVGQVQDAQGAPVSGARIQVIDEGGQNLSNFNRVRSGTDGSFTYPGVGPGSYSVTAHGDTQSEVQKIKMYEGGQETVLLILRAE